MWLVEIVWEASIRGEVEAIVNMVCVRCEGRGH